MSSAESVDSIGLVALKVYLLWPPSRRSMRYGLAW